MWCVVMKKEDCVQTREVGSRKMTVKLCSMIDSCDCENLDCCLKKE